MANQWGTKDTEETSLPNWFVDTNVVDNADNVIQKNVDRPHQINSNQEIAASDKGWEKTVTYVDSNGNIRKKSEVLVAQGKLATTFVEPAIVDATFDKGAYAATDTIRVNVRFSEDVKVTAGAPVPSIEITCSGASGPETLSYNGSSGQEFANNVLSFVGASAAEGSAGETILITLASPITEFVKILGVTTNAPTVSQNFTAAMTDNQTITLT